VTPEELSVFVAADGSVPDLNRGADADLPSDDDRRLVRGCLEGDTASYRSLVDRYQGLLFGLCYRLVGHRQDAEDIVQDVFLRAFRSLSGWDASRPLKPWLAKIAVNCCRTALAGRVRRHTPTEFIHQLADERAEARNPSGPGTDLGEELQLALENLREDYRTCFVMYHQQELSLSEVADALDRPEGTIKIWLYRARRELAEQLRRRGVVMTR
jgi:RNA polymerase sigma-70 factor (ECF subfamily)